MAATAPTVALSGSDALTKTCEPGEAPGRARELARDDQLDVGRAHRAEHVAPQSRERAAQRARYPDCHVSHELWFLWLILGLKMPLIGLFYFIFRVMRAQDQAWEQGELDGGWDDDDDDGGGGEPRVKPPTPPGGPGVRRQPPKPKAPQPAAARPAAAPRRRAAAPSRCARTTRGPLPAAHRPRDSADYSGTVSTCAS